ncbi:uncharacterized protein LODBEIA_P33200 [Lodderomyces beijingensis]|uniref:DNA topoisomerase (ATP-hydrolyzing) n=1 Tax=Lodderomyces beijingensis TaxID=1775926 RepID=A0ABP0ZPQ3_9ASCO
MTIEETLLHIWQQISHAVQECHQVTLHLHKNGSSSKSAIYKSISHAESELQHFASLLKLTKILIEHLQTAGKQTTVRDIYYRDVELFNKSQPKCKSLLTEIVNSLSWSLTRHLNIHPTQKGLFFGYNIFKTMIKEPVLIPIEYEDNFANQLCINRDSKLVLVILEKDAVFESFCKYLLQKNTDKIPAQILLVTGKGFADSLTLRFIKWFLTLYPSCKCIGFFDSDAYGLNIFNQFETKIENSMKFGGAYMFKSEPITWLNIPRRDLSVLVASSTKFVNSHPECHRELTRGAFLMKKAEMNIAPGDYNECLVKELNKFLT